MQPAASGMCAVLSISFDVFYFPNSEWSNLLNTARLWRLLGRRGGRLRWGGRHGAHNGNVGWTRCNWNIDRAGAVPWNLQRRVIHNDGILNVITFDHHRLLGNRHDGPSIDNFPNLHRLLVSWLGGSHHGHHIGSDGHRSVQDRLRSELDGGGRRWGRRLRLQHFNVGAIETEWIMGRNICPIRRRWCIWRNT